MAKFRAPVGNGEVLAVPGFDAVPALVEENRRRLNREDVRIDGLSLRELRTLARREVLELENNPVTQAGLAAEPSLPRRTPDTDVPLLIAGHQPELSHPGVWVKHFALYGLATKVGGIGLNLIVDNDTLKSTSLRVPVFHEHDPLSVHLETPAFDTFVGEEPYESRRVLDEDLFGTFPVRTRSLWANWGYEPLLATDWRLNGNVGETFTAMRRAREQGWGCNNLELRVGRLSQARAFARFARHILGDLSRFRSVYNTAVRAYREANDIHSRNHPAPELAEGEAPFWVQHAAGLRTRAGESSDIQQLRPRALTLTLFARVCLGDFFIHGIGGGKYDEVTDDIIRNYFGIEPPSYQVLSATLHLPLPGFPSTREDLKRAERLVRDLHWNPQRHLPPGTAVDLIQRKAALARNEPLRADHAARQAWFRALQETTEQLRPLVAEQIPDAEAEAARIRSEIRGNEVLRRRDFAWVLYPEAVLKPFLLRFLRL
jgi:hypothetical protein